MKKILLAIVLVLCLAGLSSCSKQCYCKASVNGKEVQGNTYFLEDGKKCSDYNYHGTWANVAVDYSCKDTM
ncbi:MAG: hypothetical protein J6Y88_07240 [Bacteroidales bacterium]|jgi:hypothetical protein|nr:hypothetical protein [Bacteroidales bacterium]